LRTPTILKILMADSLVQWIEQVISSFGYAGVATLMLLENLFPPIPSEAILPLVGFLVNRGDLAGIPALLAATLGSLVGALVLYALGRWGGRPLVLRYRRVLRVTEAELDRADGWFDRYGSWIVLFGRMVPFARSVVSIPAGLSEMPVWRFALLTALGSVVWNALLIGAGWFLGENWLRVTGFMGSLSNIVLVIVVVGMVGLGVWWWRRQRQA
jgi:membrane protein DedA with SNARE-associated domain